MSDIYLLYARYVARAGRWVRVVGPMWLDRAKAEQAVASNVSPYIEYKVVGYRALDEVDAEDTPSMLDPRVGGELSP